MLHHNITKTEKQKRPRHTKVDASSLAAHRHCNQDSLLRHGVSQNGVFAPRFLFDTVPLWRRSAPGPRERCAAASPARTRRALQLPSLCVVPAWPGLVPLRCPYIPRTPVAALLSPCLTTTPKTVLLIQQTHINTRSHPFPHLNHVCPSSLPPPPPNPFRPFPRVGIRHQPLPRPSHKPSQCSLPQMRPE